MSYSGDLLQIYLLQLLLLVSGTDFLFACIVTSYLTEII